ncbi:MAG: hypothetical protein ACFFDH_11420 [Promethearchaeota archaeon]
MIYFSILTILILRRKKQRTHLIFSGFFLCTIIGLIFNMIYAAITIDYIVIILHFLSDFFVFFGLIFILILHIIILKPPMLSSVKRQNSYMIFYGILLFLGMLILILPPFEGVSIHNSRYIKWKPYFFIYSYSIVTCMAIIPIFYSSFKIYFKLETEVLKRKWFYYLLGSLGLVVFVLYPYHISNLLVYIMEKNMSFLNILWIVESILGLSVVLWVSLMYYGIVTMLDLSNIYFLLD